MSEWKVVDWIADYKGVLEVSNDGRVRRRGYQFTQMHWKWKVPMTVHKPDIEFIPQLSRTGYPELSLRILGKRKRFFVHRLVARAFVAGYREDLCVNHINGIKTDNRAENLEWVTLARNSEHQWETGLVDLRGDAHPTRKLSSGKVRIIRDLLALGATANSLAVLLEVSPSLIDLIRDGKRWSDLPHS